MSSRARWRALALTLAAWPLLALLLMWEIASRVAANSTLVPPPAKVWAAFVAMWGGDLPQDIGASLLHLVIGYTAGAGVGWLAVLLVSIAALGAVTHVLKERFSVAHAA